MKLVQPRWLFVIGLLATLHYGNACSTSFTWDPASNDQLSSLGVCKQDESHLRDWSPQATKVGYLSGRKITYAEHSSDWILIDGDKLVRAKGLAPTKELSTQMGIGVPVGQRWPGGVIPYVISANLPNPARVNEAIEHWNTLTSGVIRLIPRTNEADYVSFNPVASGCAAVVGYYAGTGAHPVEISDLCGSGNIAHEIGHIVGLDHEQNRKDRDQFIQINMDKVLAGFESNFRIESTYQNYFVYDFNSLMHYTLFAFSTDGTPTIVPKVTLPEGFVVGQRRGLSLGDLNSVRLLYGFTPLENGQQPVPGVSLSTSSGLFARYYTGPQFDGSVVPRIDRVVDFQWNQDPPITGISADRFSVRWTGFLKPPQSGVYTLSVWSTEQTAFHFENNPLFSVAGDGSLKEVRSLGLNLEQGRRYAVKLELRGETGTKQIRLRWTRPDGIDEIIPTEALDPESSETPAVCGNSVSR